MASTKNVPDKMYTREEAAEKLNMAVSTLDRRRYAGMIEEVRLGPHKIRFTEEALRQYLLSRTKPALNAGLAADQ